MQSSDYCMPSQKACQARHAASKLPVFQGRQAPAGRTVHRRRLLGLRRVPGSCRRRRNGPAENPPGRPPRSWAIRVSSRTSRGKTALRAAGYAPRRCRRRRFAGEHDAVHILRRVPALLRFCRAGRPAPAPPHIAAGQTRQSQVRRPLSTVPISTPRGHTRQSPGPRGSRIGPGGAPGVLQAGRRGYGPGPDSPGRSPAISSLRMGR